MGLKDYINNKFGKKEKPYVDYVAHAKKVICRTKHALDIAISQTKYYKSRCLERASRCYIDEDISASWNFCMYAAQSDSKIEQYEMYLRHQKDMLKRVEQVDYYSKHAKGDSVDLESLLRLCVTSNKNVKYELNPFLYIDEMLKEGFEDSNYGTRDMPKLKEEIRRDEALKKAAYCYFAFTAISAEDYKKKKPACKLVGLRYDALPELEPLC
jgi:hypothetical protein